MYTFGYGDTGQLGHGVGFHPGIMDVYRTLVPTPVAALEGINVVRRCRLTVTKPALTAPMVSALKTIIRQNCLRRYGLVQVSASKQHVAAVTRDGKVYTWGGGCWQILPDSSSNTFCILRTIIQHNLYPPDKSSPTHSVSSGSRPTGHDRSFFD